ncbi:Calcium-responsive transcription factor [Oopsacas minuta]|uniref:Calcium-responsive transcription factor n=1 Tax=Oopsacas minuta TaxID=111878 RepID=A0AAV7JBR0_9METZ|nr:Calcium-responsive transcription factor [Oopsacas minuta]
MIPANISYYDLLKNNLVNHNRPLTSSPTTKDPEQYSIQISKPYDSMYNGGVYYSPIDSENMLLEVSENRDESFFNEDWTSLLHGAQFASNGKCFTGYVNTPEELQQVFDSFKRVTGTAYSTRVPCCMEKFDGIAQEKFLNSLSRPRLFWKMHVGEPHIPYDRVPFMTYGQMAEFPCIYGPKTRKYAGEVKRENKLISLPGAIDSANAKRYKVSCQAHITIRRILRFPEHELVEDSFPGVAALRKAKKQALEDLADAISKGSAKPEDRYYISLPTPLAHSNHDLYASYMNLGSDCNLDASISDQIYKLVNRGVTTIDQIQTKLYEFVQSNLTQNSALDASDRSFFPHKNDITNHIYSLYETGKLVDTDNSNRASDMMDKGLISPIPDLHLSGTPSSVTSIAYDQVAKDSVNYSIFHIVPNLNYDQYSSREGGFLNNNPKKMDSESRCSNQGENEQSPAESEPDAIDVESFTEIKSYQNIVQMENKCEESPREGHSPSKSPPTQEAFADTTSKPKMITIQNRVSTPNNFNCFSTISPMELQIDSLQLQPHLEHMREVNLAADEVRNILQIIEYQTYVCRDLESLNLLRRQITGIATGFSRKLSQTEQNTVHNQKRSSDSSLVPSPKSQKLK